MKHHLPAARIRKHQETGQDILLLEIEAPEIAQAALPGQFVHIRVSRQLDPLLRRPVSICGIDRLQGLIRLWYQVVGKGTRLLSALSGDATIDVIGPLGRGFDMDIQRKKVVLIGGGMGIAPLLFLGGELAENNSVMSFFGAKSSGQLPGPPLTPAVGCSVATEDGSAGHKGLVTELLADRLKKERPDRIYACGPRGMLAGVAQLARQYGIPLQVSLEAYMACGVGACLGCTCAKSRKDEETWLKACQDGPVFWEEEVIL